MMKIQVNATELRWALAATLPHASKDETVPVLCVVKFIADADGLRLAATDRYTLAEARITSADVDLLEAGEFALDRKDAATLLRAIPKSRAYVRVTIVAENNKVTLDLPGATVTYGTVEGTFPAYEKLIDMSEAHLDAPLGMNPAMLAKWVSAQHSNWEVVRLLPHGSDKPMTVLCGDNFRGLQMRVKLT